MTKLKKFLAVGTSVATAIALSPSLVLAQFTNNIDAMPVSGLGNSAAQFTFSRMLSVIINLVLGLAGLIAFIFLIMGGLQWMLAGGDKEGTEKARKRITAALIGLAIVFSAYALMFLVNSIFGINLLQFSIPNNFRA